MALQLQRGGSQTEQDQQLLRQDPLQKQKDEELVVDSSPKGEEEEEEEEEESLDAKVRRAMKKLGLAVEEPATTTTTADNDATCKDGVCEIPNKPETEQDPNVIADQIASSMKIDRPLAMAAVGATATVHEDGSRTFNEIAARQMIVQELQAIHSVPEDSSDVKTLVEEGHSVFEARRALAFAEGSMDDARAILLAEQEDAQELDNDEQSATQQHQQPPPSPPTAFKTVEVKADFDPTQTTQPAQEETKQAAAPPKPAEKSKVVFDATSKQIQELVLESPVPVLLDIYADWCGPCKVLGPVLEEMAIKSGGMFRLVKVNTDNERPVSGALEVTALPTVFGIKNGKIVNVFQGMPRSQEAMQAFMMGLMVNESHFNPAVTEEQKQQFAELTSKLIKMAGSACFPFASREKLQDRVIVELDKLVEQSGDFATTEDSAKIIKSLLNNVIREPHSIKFRTINLENKVIAAKVKQYPACLAILKSVGFSKASDSDSLIMHKNKPVINVAPLIVARDAMDKWLDASRYEVAKAARKRKDEQDRVLVQQELEAQKAKAAAEEQDEEEEEVDPDACTLKLRIEGKKKVHDLNMHADDKLRKIVKRLPVSVPEGAEIKITCAAKRLVVHSTDKENMKKTLRSLGLHPAASIVVAIGGSSDSNSTKTSERSKLLERAAQKKKKKGTHTMQSVGIYSKDDNAKGNLIDGGGGTWYEHDVTDDEEDEKALPAPEQAEDDSENQTASPAQEEIADEHVQDDEYDDDEE